ncbi:membrane anchor subunit of succinate dehydrogenase, Sdh4 [Oleoguttula sp. CCFEE 5521]
MAYALRPTLLRRALAAPVSRSITTSTSPALRQLRLTTPILRQCPRATFQTSTARKILPPLPQVIEGTINDAAPVPEPEPLHGSYHWSFERGVSIALVPLTVIPFAAGSLSPLLDGGLIGLLILHSYMGFGACITDYFPTWRTPITRKLADWANFLAIFVVGWGFYEFETNDVGVTEAVRKIWKA